MISTKLNSFFLAVSVGVFSTSALATQQINQCGTVITQPGHYELANSLLCVNDPTKPAITVSNTKHVTIHMKGRSISFILKKLPILIFPPKFEPPKAIGILAINSKDVEVKGDGALSSITKAQTGVMARNSEDVKVEKISVRNSKVGVSFQGPQSKDGKIEESVLQQNSCDVQIKLGAQSPEIEDTSVNTFCS